MFTDSIEFAIEDLIDNFTDDVLYEFVSSTFLNGYINFVEPVKVYLLDRYVRKGKKYQEQIWEKFFDKSNYHPELNNLLDDILLLGETDGHWWMFWFDQDVSDCCIGRVRKETLSREEAVEKFDKYVQSLITPQALKFLEQIQHQDYDSDEEYECITGYREIPVDQIPNGWKSWY